jgi:hypothetical protein
MAASDWTAKVEQMCRMHTADARGKVAELQKQSKSEQEFAAKVLEYGADSTRPMIDDLAGAVRDNDKAKAQEVTSKMRAETGKARAAAGELGIDACVPDNSTS